MDDPFLRTRLLIGDEVFKKLESTRIAIFGLGGVGSYAAEAIARSGVGYIDIFDGDVIDITNINRQLIATMDTLGLPKTEIMKKRIKLINPNATVRENYLFFGKDNSEAYDFSCYDYVIDAIDMVSSKLLLIEKAKRVGVPIISCMGTGNKFSPMALEVADIYSTNVCPLARVMRRELKKRNIKSLKVVYSREKPLYIARPGGDVESFMRVNASISFVPSVAGFILASEAIRDIIK